MDPYEVLGLDQTASQEEIKRRFRRLSMRHHPDRNNNSTASNAAFQRITEAYSKIDTKEKRSALAGSEVPDELYKFFMETHMQNSMRERTRPSVPHEGASSALAKPPPIVKKISVPFELSYTGGQVPLKIERQMKTGQILETETETIYLQLPPGIDENELIVARGKGNIVDHERGDVKVFVQIESHKIFTRTGMNLIYDHKITLKQSLCGFSISIPYLDGKTLKIHNKAGTIITPGFQKNIPGYGFKREGHCGSLVVRFEVIFPDHLEAESILALGNLLPDV
jgi:DnaJ-class molecular chaperone